VPNKQTNLRILELFETRVDLAFENCVFDHISERWKSKKNDNHVSKKNLKKTNLLAHPWAPWCARRFFCWELVCCLKRQLRMGACGSGMQNFSKVSRVIVYSEHLVSSRIMRISIHSQTDDCLENESRWKFCKNSPMYFRLCKISSELTVENHYLLVDCWWFGEAFLNNAPSSALATAGLPVRVYIDMDVYIHTCIYK